MVSWTDFEALAPDLAKLGRERLERLGFALVGTIRRDGTPRISPVEVRFVQRELAVNILSDSLKARDLDRDARILLHSPMLSSDDPNDEFKLRGRAREDADPDLCAAVADLTWHPPPESRVFVVDIESAAFVAWSKGEMTVTRWSSERGLH
jgi:Pyridoxamine 5'-phosphate oxidase